ncbi:MAG: alpha/beta hydrolase [Spirochaetes bacterium]|nr:alpha/beta hydrolase [Spirochaetota bacterium]
MDNKHSSKNSSLGYRIFKYLLSSIGILVIFFIALIAWIYFAQFSGPGPMEINGFHPFRSEKAKTHYFSFEKKMAKRWPINSEERLVHTSFGKTFVRISGPTNAPPLVLIPGGGTNSFIWHANIRALSQYYRTYALDNIYDYGRSIYLQELKSGKDYSDWLNEFFDTLGLGNSIGLIGYSYGGWVASQYALHHPERLNHVVLIAPVYFISPLPAEYIRRMLFTLIPVRHFKARIMYWAWADLARMGEYGRQLVEERIDYYQLSLKSFKFKQPVNPVVLTISELKSLKMPVLFLAGNHETAFNAENTINQLNRINPMIKTVLLSNTGHDLMFTHTDVVNSKIINFLKN